MELGVGAVKELKALVPEAKRLPIRTLYINKHIDLKPQTEVVGGWGTTPPGSAVAFGFSYFLQKELNLPVGVIVACWGSSSIEGWMPLELTRQLPHFKDIMDKFYADQEQVAICKKIISSFNKNKKFPKKYSNNEQENSALEKKYRNINIFARTRPNLLYNAMMHPLIPYSVKGLVWYQGEANTKSISAMKQYKISLKVWISKLRELWRNDELDALVVMLPGFGRVLKGNKDLNYPGNYTWATMRESQLAAMQLPHTYVANTIDLGEANNIHPKDKLQVCQRLALLAGARVYEKGIVGSGPIFSSGRADKEKFVITFTNASGLKTLDGEPAKAFWLADRKEHWVPAKAEIKGNQVILTAEGMSKPIACRYAYSAKPEVNLVNSAGLPAYPFRTDSWE
jgi:sialate O-acetylesterase